MVLLSISSKAEFTGTKMVKWAPKALSSAAIPEDYKQHNDGCYSYLVTRNSLWIKNIIYMHMVAITIHTHPVNVNLI